MIRSIDILSRNFNVLQEKQQNISANAANASTPGYKFQDVIQSALPEGEMNHFAGGPRLNEFQALGGFTFGTQIEETITNFENGGLQHTGNATDYAVLDDGFFTIEGPGGQNYYTRNGQFTTNDAGELITLDGYTVQTNGVDLMITSFEGTENLVDIGNGYFTGGGGEAAAGTTNVYQGYLETSNVDMADMMIELIQVQREFEANQSVLQGSNDTLRKATNEIGSVR